MVARARPSSPTNHQRLPTLRLAREIAPERGWPQAVKATCASIESVGSRRPCGAIVGSGAGTDCGTGRGGCAVLAARSGGAEISVRDLPGGEAAEATAGTGADPVAAAAVCS